jgi:hypothetical protein
VPSLAASFARIASVRSAIIFSFKLIDKSLM